MAGLYRAALALTLTGIAGLAFSASGETLPPVFLFSDKLNHAGAFCVLAFLADGAFPAMPMLRKAALLFAYGVAIEAVQYFLPSREFSVFDMVANGAGMLVYIAGKRIARSLR